MAKKKRRFGIERLGNVLSRDKAVLPGGGPGSFEGPSLQPISSEDWERAVGSRIAHRTRPFKLFNGNLMVLTVSSAWAQELSLLSDPILQALTKIDPRIKTLRFKVGPLEDPIRTLVHAAKAPIPIKLPIAMRNALDRVPDDDLRQAIGEAASIYLGAQATNDPPGTKRRQ